ncbi:MAG: sulfotransferase family protein [Hyphomicrobium sp.]|uniref:sulfotransferase family protein n=1 Tax=Hyphomicrobium sp. TaxID=82 RepID=UPI003D143F0D
MSLAVIGAGLGRTGTLSLKQALEQLGFGPCHHMEEVMAHPGQIPAWHAAGRGEAVDWAELLAGYRSTVDWPSAQFWSDLAEKFPAARIVLTVRDTERWYESFSQTILKLLGVRDVPDPTIRAILAMTRDVIVNRAFDGRLDDPDHIKARFERHNAEVKAAAPPDRLLVFEVAQGWAPLCAFLGVAVPTVPFPRVNSTREFWESIEKGGV